MKHITTLLALLALLSCKTEEKKGTDTEVQDIQQPKWIQLFNGKDLSGWTPKITKHPIGDNYMNTFRVSDSVIEVNYDGYEQFDKQYGHLFYEKPYSAYFLAVEYRFKNEQANGGEGWAWRNSGAMLHSQPPETMTVDQDFPISIEGQFLGGNGTDPRSTQNLCTPGTSVFIADTLYTPHCINSDSKTFDGDQWVRAGFLVLKDSLIQHYANGEMVLEYTHPERDEILPGTDTGLKLEKGYISLQSESHPIEFRKVEIIDLDSLYNDKSSLQKEIDLIRDFEKNYKLSQ
ncbi:3-keto-disaccharide hydrolase [Robertkochia solimangrovi]|uniref:3-keto-disaccharide hydrolase n=1 Tax=Robertkochia solimangrovi TaxID=2213046 RepID=UPI0011807248|nr:DUF1080 domain-containing protein [Robertkochia solimangrovi]TRZ45862.1 DUF1080 domain-containing protein [Robertkochia solimangrovi]